MWWIDCGRRIGREGGGTRRGRQRVAAGVEFGGGLEKHNFFLWIQQFFIHTHAYTYIYAHTRGHNIALSPPFLHFKVAIGVHR